MILKHNNLFHRASHLVRQQKTCLKMLPFVNILSNFLRCKKISTHYIPKVFYIETTNYCNAKCYMCPHTTMRRKKGTMSWNLFEKIINECVTFEGKGLVFFLHKDGEPLLDPLLFKRVKHLKERLRYSKVGFNSNAMLLSEKMSMNILTIPIDFITFSIDGASTEQYEKIRIGLRYEIVERNLNTFFELKQKLNKKTPHVTMQMVVSENNKHEINRYKELWSGKANQVYFKAMHNFLIMGSSIRSDKLSIKQLEICLQPFQQMFIYWNGDVGLCCWDYDHLINLGDIRDDTILQVFNNDKFKKVRSAMRRKNCKNIYPCNICSQIYGKDMHMSYF